MLNFLDRLDLTLTKWDFNRFYHLPETPHYHLVPKDEDGNREWRKYCLDLGKKDRQHARKLWEMCAQDVLFYVNTFCYTFSPKDYPDQPHRPFITYPFQDDAILRISRRIGSRETAGDVAIPKSRDMGATWLCIAALEHRWHFRDGQTFLLVSRKEEYVDKRGAPKELFWKVDYLHKYQPSWLLPPGRDLGRDDPNRIKMHLENMETGSVFDGEATVKDLGRGDRLTAILLDEHASMKDAEDVSKSTRDATNCRICNSTPKGTSGTGAEFYKFCSNPNTEVIVLHWALHPEKGAGLYRGDPNTTKITKLDKSYKFPKDYPFVADGKLRSPWYDRECKRANSLAEIAQELDIDFLKTGWPFFNPQLIEDLKRQTNLHQYVGWLDATPDGERTFREAPNGPLRIWCNLYDQGEGRSMVPKRGNYVVGCDIAMGTGGDYSSNSVASIFDCDNGKKVGEFASNEISPLDFADLAVAICKWFHDAGLIWESNGFGAAFGKKVVSGLGYSNIYMRRTLDQMADKQTKKPGWFSGKAEKRLLLSQYGEALKLGKFFNCSKEALQECHEYVHTPDGNIVHDKSRVSDDSAESGDNHGDRVIADALAWRMAVDHTSYTKPEVPVDPPMGSYAWRRKQWERNMAAETAW